MNIAAPKARAKPAAANDARDRSHAARAPAARDPALPPRDDCCPPRHRRTAPAAARPAAGGCARSAQDVSEQLEYVPARFKVIRHVRPKLACVSCQAIFQAAAPSRPIARGMAGPGLLAHVLVSKYCDHTPLYRQSAHLRARGRASSTARRWPAGSTRATRCSTRWWRRSAATCWPAPRCTPTTRRCRCSIPAAAGPRPGGCGSTCATTDPAASTEPPAVWFRYSPDRKGEHPQQHLKHFRGILQADAYARLRASSTTSGRIREAACWAHARRKFWDLHRGRAARRIAGRAGAAAHRRALRDRGRDPRPAARRAATSNARRAPDRCSKELHAWLSAMLAPRVGEVGAGRGDRLQRSRAGRR